MKFVIAFTLCIVVAVAYAYPLEENKEDDVMVPSMALHEQNVEQRQTLETIDALDNGNSGDGQGERNKRFLLLKKILLLG